MFSAALVSIETLLEELKSVSLRALFTPISSALSSYHRPENWGILDPSGPTTKIQLIGEHMLHLI